MADRIPDSLIDDILASTKSYTDKGINEEKESKIDIDALIMSISSGSKSKEKKHESESEDEILKTFAAKKEETKPEAEEKESKTFDRALQNESFSKEEEKAKESTTKSKIDPSKYGRIEESNYEINDAKIIAEEILESDIEDEEKSEETENLSKFTQPEEEIEEKKEDPLKEEKQISLEKTRMFNEVKVHGEFNPNIEHNLGNKVTRTMTGEAEPLSSPIMGEEKYRKHFMNKPVQNLEKTQEHRAIILSAPEKTMETPGVIVRRNEDAASSLDGVEPIPQIIPAEDELKRFEKTKDRSDIKVKAESQDDNQIMLEGFGEEEEIRQLSEEEAEAELRKARRKAVEEFVSKGLIFKQDVEENNPEIPEENPENTKGKKRFKRQKIHVAREYFGPKDAVAVEDEYYSEGRKIKFRLISTAILGLVMCILSTSVGFNNGNFAIYNNNENIYLLVQLVCLFACCLINLSAFKNFFVNLGSKQANINTLIAVSAAAAFIQIGVSFAFTDSVESVAHLVTAAGVMPMLIKAISDLIQNKNDRENFYIASDIEKDIYSVENIDDEETANEIARGLMLGDPEIKYSKGITIPTKFVELSRTADATVSFYKYSIPAIIIAAIVIGLVAGFVGNNIYAGISTFSMVILMGLPASAVISASASLRHANKVLNEEGSLVNGFAAVEDAINSNGIIIDCSDAFQRGGCNIEGIKLYHKMRIDEAILYTASVVIESGGVLSTVFEGVIDGKNQLLLPVESLAYEEKLGCSCWIHNHRVLVGNRELLKHHNVEIDDDELENRYKGEGKNVIYLAIEGTISAMFVVVYKSEAETAKYIRWVEKDGIALFFRTSDANMTEEFIEREFRLPPNTVKIINPVAGEMFQKVRQGFKDRSEAKILHDGRVVTMLKAINAACGINSIINVTKIVQTIAAVVGVILVALMAFLSGLDQIGAFQIIIYHLFWCFISYIIPKIKKV